MKPNLTDFQKEMLEIYYYLSGVRNLMTANEQWWFKTLAEEANFADWYNLYFSQKQMTTWRGLYEAIDDRAHGRVTATNQGKT
jgi:hypothetical protein